MQKNGINSNQLKFLKPAPANAPWESSLPIGNGRVGAFIQGGVRNERIMITNKDALWQGSVGVLPDVSDKLKEVRGFMQTKNPVMAGAVLERAFENKKYNPVKYSMVPICDLIMEQTIPAKLSAYSRVLSLTDEEVSVNFTSNGTKFERKCFVSFDDDLVYFELNKVGASPIAVNLSVVNHDKTNSIFDDTRCVDFDNENKTVTGSLLGYEFEYAGMVYGALARVVVDTKAILQIADDKLKIENAEKILIIVKTYVAKAKEKVIEKYKHELLSMRQLSYINSFKKHLSIFSKCLPAVELNVSKEKDDAIENLIAEFNDSSTLLYEKLFNFGKYLFAVGLPNDFFAPMVTGLWGKHYDNKRALAGTSTNLTALYSPAFMFGGLDKMYSVIKYFLKYQDDLKKNAYRVYKSKGFMVPEYFVSDSGLPASIKSADISIVTGGAVIANLFYDYFLYTKDLKFLKNEALPFMTSVADFYLNYFFVGADGKLNSVPSFSPCGKSKYFENRDIGVYANSTADFVVVRTLLNNIMNVANIYAVTVEKIVEYQNFLNKMPVLPIEKNEIKEFRDEENSTLSSGYLQFFGVYGEHEVNSNANATSIAPYLNTLAYKVDKALFSQNLTSLGRMAEVSAILGQGVASNTILRYLINNFLGDNLMFLNADKSNYCAFVDGDNFINLAGNMLFCTTIMESMVLDYNNNIMVLPAKPSSFVEGSIKNVLTRQNCLVDVSFDDKRGNMVVALKATKQTRFNLILPKGVKKVKNYQIDVTSPRIENIVLAPGKQLVLEIKY